MFEFKFSGNDSTNSEINSTILWRESEEITIKDEHLHSCMSKNEGDILEYTCGSLKLKHFHHSKAVEDARLQGLENISLAESQHSDLLPGVYEGGLKVWECTRDLLDYLNQQTIHWQDAKVLDLGCGAGLIGIYAFMRGSKVIFQDYNPEVLQLLTIPNLMLNVSNENIKSARFFSGDWLSFSKLLEEEGESFDIILTSETIYNTDNYEKIHDIITKHLSVNGVCYLAAKSTYFGVGGTVHSFLAYLKNKNDLLITPCWSTKTGVIREILKIQHGSDSQ